MDIYFLCPKCETKFAIDESGAGMVFRCTKCNTKLSVPEPSKPSPAPVVPKVTVIPPPSTVTVPPPVSLSPAVTPVAPQPKTKTEKIPESKLPQQSAPAAPAPPVAPTSAPKIIVPKISVEPAPAAPIPPPQSAPAQATAPAAPSTEAPSAIQMLREAQVRLEKQLAERSAALDQSTQQVAALQRDLQQKTSALEGKLAATQKSLADSQRALEERDKELKDTESAAHNTREEAAKKFTSLTEQIAEAQKKSATAQAQISQLKAALEAAPKSDSVESLRRDLDTQQQRISELERYEQLSVELQNQTRELKTELTERDKLAAEQQRALSNLQSQITESRDALKKSQSEAEARVVALASEKAELERRLEANDTHIRQLEILAAQAPAASEMMRLQDEARQRTAEIADLRHANEEIAASSHSQLTETQEQLAAVQQQMAESQRNSAEKLQQLQSALQSHQTEAQQRITTLAEERAQVAAQLNDAQSHLQRLRSELSEKEKLLAAAALSGDKRFEQAQTDLRVAREEADSRYAALEQKKSALSQQLVSAASRLAPLQAQLAEKDNALRLAQQEAAARLQETNDSLEALRRESAAEIETLRTQLAKKEQVLSVSTENTQQKLQQADTTLDAMRHESAAKLAQIADEKSRLAAQLHEATEELESLRMQLNTAPTQDNVVKLQSALDAARREKIAVEEKITDAQESARAAAADLSAKLKRALDDKSELHARLRGAEADLALAREKLLFFERQPSRPTAETAPESAASDEPTVTETRDFPPPSPIFSFTTESGAEAVMPDAIPEVDDLKSDTPPPLRFKTAAERSSRPIIPDVRPVSHGNGESTVAVADAPSSTTTPLPEPVIVPRRSYWLLYVFLAVALVFAGVGGWLWLQSASNAVDPTKFEAVVQASLRVEQLTSPAPLQFVDLVNKLESEVKSARDKANRGNERSLVEQFERVRDTYRDIQIIWELARANNNLASTSDERVRRIASKHELKRIRIAGRDEEFVEANLAIPALWQTARQQLRDAHEFMRNHQVQPQ